MLPFGMCPIRCAAGRRRHTSRWRAASGERRWDSAPRVATAAARSLKPLVNPMVSHKGHVFSRDAIIECAPATAQLSTGASICARGR